MKRKFERYENEITVPGSIVYTLWRVGNNLNIGVPRESATYCNANLGKCSFIPWYEGDVTTSRYRSDLYQLEFRNDKTEAFVLSVPSSQSAIVYDTYGRKTTNRCHHIKVQADFKPGEAFLSRELKSSSGSRYYTISRYAGAVPPELIERVEDIFLTHSRPSLKSDFPVRTVALSEFLNRVVNPFENELGVAVGELVAVASSIKKISLGVAKLKEFPGAFRKKLRKLGSSIKALPQELSDNYLAYMFGFKPLAEEVAKLVAFTPLVMEHLRKLQEQNFGDFRRVFKEEISSSDTSEDEFFTETVTVQTTLRTLMVAQIIFPGLSLDGGWYSRLRKVHQQASLVFEYYGLRLTARRYWNIVPMSFLVDRLLPIADFLESLEAGRLGIRITPRYLVASAKTVVTKEITHKASGATASVTITSFRRRPISVSLFIKGKTNLKPGLTDLALAVQRL